MRPLLWVAILLMVLGVVGLVRGGFSYTKDSSKAKLGPVEIHVKDKERVRLSPVVSSACLVGGAALAFYALRRR